MHSIFYTFMHFCSFYISRVLECANDAARNRVGDRIDGPHERKLVAGTIWAMQYLTVH